MSYYPPKSQTMVPVSVEILKSKCLDAKFSLDKFKSIYAEDIQALKDSIDRINILKAKAELAVIDIQEGRKINYSPELIRALLSIFKVESIKSFRSFYRDFYPFGLTHETNDVARYETLITNQLRMLSVVYNVAFDMLKSEVLYITDVIERCNDYEKLLSTTKYATTHNLEILNKYSVFGA